MGHTASFRHIFAEYTSRESKDTGVIRVSFNGESKEESTPSERDGAFLLLQQPLEACEVASTGPSRQEIIDYMRENARAWHKQASRPYKFQHIQAEELLEAAK